MNNFAQKPDAEIISASLQFPSLFEDIFDRHFTPVYRYFARREGVQIADDLASQVFEKAFEVRHKFDCEHGDALPWLYGISANMLRAHRRSLARRFKATSRAHESEKLNAVVIDSPSDIYTNEVKRDIWKAFGSLRSAEQEVLLLFVWEELSYSEIARALELPLGTVKSRVYRAQKTLENKLRWLSPSENDLPITTVEKKETV